MSSKLLSDIRLLLTMSEASDGFSMEDKKNLLEAIKILKLETKNNIIRQQIMDSPEVIRQIAEVKKEIVSTHSRYFSPILNLEMKIEDGIDKEESTKELAGLKAKIARVNEIEAAMGNIPQALDVLFPEEEEARMAQQYLFEKCALAMAHLKVGSERINGKNLFDKSGEKRFNFRGATPNPQAISEFLSVLERNDALILARDCVMAQSRVDRVRSNEESINETKECVEKAEEQIHTPEYEEFLNFLEEAASTKKTMLETRALAIREENQNPITKFFSRVRNLISREQTEVQKHDNAANKYNQMQNAHKDRLAKDNQYRDVVDVYMAFLSQARDGIYPNEWEKCKGFKMAHGNIGTIEEMSGALTQVKGREGAILDRVKGVLANETKKSNDEKTISEKQYEQATAKLTPEAQQILDNVTPEDILRYGKYIYDQAREGITPIGAALVLKVLTQSRDIKSLEELGQQFDFGDRMMMHEKVKEAKHAIGEIAGGFKKEIDDINESR